MKFLIDSGDFRFRLPAPTPLVLNAPVLWLWLRHEGQVVTCAQAAQIVRRLRAWKKQHPTLPLLEIRTPDTIIRIDL